MTEKQLIELTYLDTCKVYRKIQTEDAFGKTIQTYDKILENIPCALSRKDIETSNQTDAENKLDYSSMLFIGEQHDIKPGDQIEITINIRGIVRKYFAGEPILYPGHQEIELKRDEKA